MIAAGFWGVTPTAEMANATTHLTLEGTTKVLGQISGTVTQNSLFSGHVNITINGGSYPCDIYGAGPTGMKNEDGTVDIVITGGDFSECWSINAYVESAPNNIPLTSVLDFSEFSGTKEALALAYSVSTGFTQVKLPGSVTEDQLIEIAGKVETEAPEVEETEAPEDETDAPEKDNEKEDDVNVGVGDAAGNSNNMLIIVIIIAIVVVAGFGTAILIVLTKKKK
jgi:hypothetical protein